MPNNALLIDPRDNVAVAILEIKAGEALTGVSGNVVAGADIPKNHKVALVRIPADDPVIKYGEPIGRASRTIMPGEWVHTHNLKAEG
jgi:altronate hydrolase